MLTNKNIFILISILFVLTIPQGVFAHALLEKATPAPDSHLQSSPEEIVLLFNERLENELYSIKVFNNLGEMISKQKTVLSENQKQMSQTLPSLSDGSYTISYSVLSSDGHPIKGSYLITVGEVSDESTALQQNLNGEQNLILISGVRFIYYIALLLLTGWILWGAVSKAPLDIKKVYRKIAMYLQSGFFITNIGLGYVQFKDLLYGWGDVGPLLTGTTIGISWVVSMLLSILGFAILFRNPWLDIVWVILLLAAKSVNGHAMAFEPPILNITLDMIHLLAASIWASGLLYILIFWSKQREYMRRFLPTFSKAALLSILLLIVSGTALTLTYLPELKYLLYTEWGKWLLIKTGCVLFVIVVGSILRFNLKKQNENHIGKLVKVDFACMIIILCIVGMFTHLSPLPQNEPLMWQEQEEHLKFNATISPKVPGENMFMVEAISDKEGVNIKRIELFLKNKDNPDVAPIQVPFYENEQAKYAHYMIDGPYLPFPGNWTLEIRILDSDDNESVYSKDFIVY